MKNEFLRNETRVFRIRVEKTYLLVIERTLLLRVNETNQQTIEQTNASNFFFWAPMNFPKCRTEQRRKDFKIFFKLFRKQQQQQQQPINVLFLEEIKEDLKYGGGGIFSRANE